VPDAEEIKMVNLWYGYKHINGSYQAKRYFDREDLQDCVESDLVESNTQPFEATNRDDAIKITRQRLG